MIPQVMTNETVAVISPDEVNFLQTDQPQPTPQRQDSLKKHLKAEVKVMAVIQIMCGVMVLSLGIILASAPTTPHLTSAFTVLLKSGYPFVGALCFVISGVLSVITKKKRTKPLVHSSLALSILSAFFALTGIIILSANLAALYPALQQCKLMRLPHPATVTFSYHLLHLESSDKTCFKAKATLTAIQIMCGVMVLSLGIILASVPTVPHFTPVFSVLLKSGYPFVGALFFIISGILSVITETKSTKSLVDGSLTMNILSISFALVGIIILSINLTGLHPASEQCKQDKPLPPPEHYYYRHTYEFKDCSTPKAVLTGALSLMLICSVLELGLAVLTAMLWWQQSHSDFSENVIFLFQDSKNKSSVSSESLCNPAHEKVLTS